MRLPRARLEDWMRRYYFTTDIDIGSSGVENYSLADLRRLLDIGAEELDAVTFHDSLTLGGPSVRKAIADRWVHGDPERVMVTHGSTEANYLIMSTLLDPDDEVVVLKPFYQQLYAVAESRGCPLRHWHLRAQEGFRPDVTELSTLIGPRTRMVVVNFPHNPTGVTLSAEQQHLLLETVRAAGVYLVWDGAFTELTYHEPPLPEPSLRYEKAISMGTLSKAYGLPGLRVGWCLAAPEILERFIRLRDYTLLHLSPLIELLAARVIESADRLVERRLETARRNRRIVSEWIGTEEGRVSWTPPAGGVCGFIRFDEDVDVEPLCHELSREDGVLLVPGSCFDHPHHARLGFGCATGDLERGLATLSRRLRRRTWGPERRTSQAVAMGEEADLQRGDEAAQTSDKGER